MRPLRHSFPSSPQVSSLLLAIALVLSPTTAVSANGSGERLSEMEAPRASRDLARWLELDCEEVDIRVLTRHKGVIVPDLIAALEKGAPPERRELVRRGAEESYAQLVEQQDRRPDRKLATQSKEAYVNRDLDNFDALYRARAAQALAAIGGADARKALESILAKSRLDEVKVREDARRAIQQYLRWTR